MVTTNPQNSSRIQTIDIIRGIALLGILVINIQTYTLFAFLRPQQVYDLQLDNKNIYAPLQLFIHIFFKGQFYTIYSFLFGLSFYLMLQKNNRLGLDGSRIMRRRLWVLLIFGLVHAFIFWFGDVLHKYAILGFTLFYFNKKSIGTIVKWIAAIILFVVVLQVIKAVFFPVGVEVLPAGQLKMDAIVMRVVDTWRYGSITEVVSLQKLGVAMLWIMGAQTGFSGLAHYEIMFLLGLIAGKSNFFHHIAAYSIKLTRAALMLVPLALALKILSCFEVLQVHLLPVNQQGYEATILLVSGFIGTILLTVVYILLLSVALQNKPSLIFVWISNAGRMGLTNYLIQTILCMLLFYGYAQGMAGNMTLLDSFIPVTFIYAFQVLYSNIWYKEYGIGPMEMVWRRLAYGKKPASNKAGHPANFSSPSKSPAPVVAVIKDQKTLDNKNK